MRSVIMMKQEDEENNLWEEGKFIETLSPQMTAKSAIRRFQRITNIGMLECAMIVLIKDITKTRHTVIRFSYKKQPINNFIFIEGILK